MRRLLGAPLCLVPRACDACPVVSWRRRVTASGKAGIHESLWIIGTSGPPVFGRVTCPRAALVRVGCVAASCTCYLVHTPAFVYLDLPCAAALDACLECWMASGVFGFGRDNVAFRRQGGCTVLRQDRHTRAVGRVGPPGKARGSEKGLLGRRCAGWSSCHCDLWQTPSVFGYSVKCEANSGGIIARYVCTLRCVWVNLRLGFRRASPCWADAGVSAVWGCRCRCCVGLENHALQEFEHVVEMVASILIFHTYGCATTGDDTMSLREPSIFGDLKRDGRHTWHSITSCCPVRWRLYNISGAVGRPYKDGLYSL